MSGTEDLPGDFDVIVIGTGLPESILAAACSRSGLTVLHLDRNEYYGGNWASFNLDGLKEWSQSKTKTDLEEDVELALPKPLELDSSVLNEGEHFVPLSPRPNSVDNVQLLWHVKESECCSSEANSSVQILESEDFDDSGRSDENTSDLADADKPSDPMAPFNETDPSPETQTSPDANEVTTGSCPATETEALGGDGTADENPSEQIDSNSPPAVVENANAEQECSSSEKAMPAIDAVSPRPALPPEEWNKTSVEAEWRRFSLDLTPKLLLSRGPLVDLLISSNVGRYAEFKVVNRILTSVDGVVKEVPCSRADVFQSKEVSMIEKRMLMKFLTFVLNAEQEMESWTDEQKLQPFEQYLESQKLTPLLKHYVVHALGMVAPSEATGKSLMSIKKFLMSTGRYGNSPFLWALYGSGELPQCFCRLCAVFGGTYYLNRGIEALITDEHNKCTAVLTEGHRISCKYLVVEESYLKTPSIPTAEVAKVSRAIVCCDSSLLPGAKEHISILNYFDPQLQRPIRIVELNHSAMVCAKGMHVVYMTVDSNEGETAAVVFKGALDHFFRLGSDADTEDSAPERKPKLLFTLTFDQAKPSARHSPQPVLEEENVVVTPLPGSELAYEAVVDFVKSEFARLWPDEEFLPAAPNPDDISFTDELDEGVNGFLPEAEQPEDLDDRTGESATPSSTSDTPASDAPASDAGGSNGDGTSTNRSGEESAREASGDAAGDLLASPTGPASVDGREQEDSGGETSSADAEGLSGSGNVTTPGPPAERIQEAGESVLNQEAGGGHCIDSKKELLQEQTRTGGNCTSGTSEGAVKKPAGSGSGGRKQVEQSIL